MILKELIKMASRNGITGMEKGKAISPTNAPP
jgi:hypothetical protein